MKRLLFSVTWTALAFTLFTSAQTNSSGYMIGDLASDFSLLNVDGRMVSLSDYSQARGFIIVFTCNHCPYAQAYEDRIMEIHRKYEPLGYPVIAINPNSPAIVPQDNYAEMQKRAKEHEFPFVYLFDAGQIVTKKYGPIRTPHVFILDSARIVQYIGTIDDNAESAEAARNHYIIDAIEALRRNQKPNPNYTRTVGCSVKYGP